MPWKAVSEYSPQANGPDEFSPYIIGADKQNVAAAMMQPRERDFLKIRGYIVHAVNAYPRLVEALERLTAMCEPSSCDEVIQARAFLKELGE